MCTVSVVPTLDGFRLACNRDERRSRPAAWPPRRRAAGRTRAVWPTDPESGGTWIGVNGAGLAMALLNRTAAPASEPPAAGTTRGIIIPRLLEAMSLEAALDRLVELDRTFSPFTLVMVQRRAVLIAGFSHGRFSILRGSIRRPLMLTSSSLGDSLVRRPRGALFAAMVTASLSPLAAQARFHAHRWLDRPDISVLMSRPDAATVSRTVIDVTAGTAHIRYVPLDRRTDS